MRGTRSFQHHSIASLTPVVGILSLGKIIMVVATSMGCSWRSCKRLHMALRARPRRLVIWTHLIRYRGHVYTVLPSRYKACLNGFVEPLYRSKSSQFEHRLISSGNLAVGTPCLDPSGTAHSDHGIIRTQCCDFVN